jgi:hypothetical protein
MAGTVCSFLYADYFNPKAIILGIRRLKFLLTKEIKLFIVMNPS